jgi:hypothetical protein
MNIRKIKNKYGITEWPEYKLNFWNIPKSMSTSVKSSLLKIDVEEYDLEEGKKLHSIGFNKFITRDEAYVNGFLNFAVIRDPYERVISMYKDFGIRRPIDNKKRDFNSFLNEIILKSEDNISSDIHFRSMSYFIFPLDKLLVDVVLTKTTVWDFLFTYGCAAKKVNLTKHLDIKLTDTQKEDIRIRYKRDFELWNLYGHKN